MTATLTAEPAVAHSDGRIVWIAHGTAAGIPYVAEGDTEADAVAEAAAAVYQCHGRRRLQALIERDQRAGSALYSMLAAKRREPMSCPP